MAMAAYFVFFIIEELVSFFFDTVVVLPGLTLIVLQASIARRGEQKGRERIGTFHLPYATIQRNSDFEQARRAFPVLFFP